jgi:cytidyltransferase-like protein
MAQLVISGGFDDLRAADVRRLETASKSGDVVVSLWSDEKILRDTGRAPKFPFAERLYFVSALRYVSRVIRADDSAIMANAAPLILSAPRKKILVTGSFDWLHTGHVRFFEEVSALGDLYVVVGHDANIRLLKGEGHPLLPQEERRYMAASIRFVKEAVISTGHGWLDAEPEIRVIKPDIYAVNEDGDQGGKREYCQKMGIEYLVLKRVPAPGLPPRSSTNLRGF